MTRQNAAGRSYVWTLAILFGLGWAMVFVNRTALYPLLPVLQEEFSLSATRAGILPSVYYLFYTAFQIPVGLSGDKIGLKRMLVLTYAGSAVGLLVVGLLARNYVVMLLSMILYGGGASGFHPMAFSITIKSVAARHRGIAVAIINSGSAVGLVFGLSFAGPAYLATGSWRLIFVLLAVPTLLLALMFAWKVRSVSADNDGWSSPTALLRDKNLLFIYLASFCSLYAFGTTVVWGPTFFLQERALDLNVAGLFTALVALSGIPAGLLLARLSDRTGRKAIAMLLMPIAALAMFGMTLAHATWAMIGLLLVYGASGKLAWEPIAVAWLGDHVSVSRSESMGTALALFGTIGMSSSIVAPVVAGWIKDTTGSLEGAFVLAGMALLLGFLCMLVPARTPQSEQVESRLAA